jgi:hypothetical protein
MLLILASTFAFSASIAASPGTFGWGFATPSIFLPCAPALLLERPVVFVPRPPELDVALEVPAFELLADEPPDDEPPEPEPDEFAVPTVFVPGAVGTFDALPAPLGSFAALFSPPGFAGPLGTPLTAAEPAPVEPAEGVPAALGEVAVGPLAAPPPVEPLALLAPPPAPPPDPPPEPPLPPPLWAYAVIGHISNAIVTILRALGFRI